jgi:virulence-associated protein VapD
MMSRKNSFSRKKIQGKIYRSTKDFLLRFVCCSTVKVFLGFESCQGTVFLGFESCQGTVSLGFESCQGTVFQIQLSHLTFLWIQFVFEATLENFTIFVIAVMTKIEWSPFVVDRLVKRASPLPYSGRKERALKIYTEDRPTVALPPTKNTQASPPSPLLD